MSYGRTECSRAKGGGDKKRRNWQTTKAHGRNVENETAVKRKKEGSSREGAVTLKFVLRGS